MRETHNAHQVDSCEFKSTWHMQSCMCCYRSLLFFIPPSLSLFLRLSSPLNTAGWLTGPLRALVAGWIKRWYKKRLKGRRKQWLLKEGEGGKGQEQEQSTGPRAASNSQSGDAARWHLSLMMRGGSGSIPWWHWVQGQSTIGSERTRYTHTHTEGPQTYPAALAASINNGLPHCYF